MTGSEIDLVLVQRRDGSVHWRVVAGNGRVLAASANSFDDQPAAEAALGTVIATAEDLTPRFTRTPTPTQWEWTALDAAGVPAAVCSRPYNREGTCRAAYRRFTDALGNLSTVRPRIVAAGRPTDRRL